MTPIQELMRRRVFRVAGIYLVTAWITTEVADVIADPLRLPDWTVTLVIVLLILLFPVAMLFAWIFDVGPGGIERTPPLKAAERSLQSFRVKLLYAGLMILGLAVLSLTLLAPWEGSSGIQSRTRNSIAVLPFANMSGNQENDYFSDGMSEEILNLLAKIPGLQVAARTSSFVFRDGTVDVRDVAEKLDVETVLEGSVRWAGADQVRITAQLIDAGTGYHLWTEAYDARLEHIFDVQDRIAKEIVRALKVTLGTEDAAQLASVAAAPTQDLQAYDMYLRGRDVMRRRGAERVQLALELFQAAVGRDPGFARAHAGLATAYMLLPEYTEVDQEEAYAQASQAAVRALTLDASLGEAHAVLAQIDAEQWNWSDAETGFFAATGLDADEPASYHWYANMLLATGRTQAALTNMQIAYELDPESPVINGALAGLHLALGNDDTALYHLAEAERLGYEQNLKQIEAVTHLRQSQWEEAARAFAAGSPAMSAEQAQGLVAAIQDPATLSSLLGGLRADAAFPKDGLFVFCVTLNQLDCAFDLADELFDSHRIKFEVVWANEAAPFRQDPRFADLVTRMGLADYWRRYGWSDFCSDRDGRLQCS